MKTAKSNHRRNFLLAAGLGGASVAAVVATRAKPVKARGEAGEAPGQPSGYHASEHILKYYKTTEV
jgi:hypothetical protein